MISQCRNAAISSPNEFKLYYQPIVDAQTFQCVGAEALLRWCLPNGKIIMPELFIPHIEKLNIFAEMEKRILNLASNQSKKWIDISCDKNFFIHVNLSPMQISRETLYNEVSMAIKNSCIENSNLTLEITETALMKEMGKAISQLAKLRKDGIGIAIDDFGTGYSSLSQLRKLPINGVKIDKSFVLDLENDAEAKKFLHHLVAMLQDMDCKIYVEGIETETQKEFLKELQVDFMQGYLFGKPMPPTEFGQKYFGNGGVIK